MAKAVGIDLGTTQLGSCCPRGWRSGRHRQRRGCSHHTFGRRIRQERRSAHGRSRQAPGDHESRSHASVGQAPHGHRWTIDIDGKDYTPQEVSARTLQKLKRDAEAYLGEAGHPGGYHGSGLLR